MSNQNSNSATDSSGLYDEAYYKSRLGPVPYIRNDHWLNFFGRIADMLIQNFAPSRVFDAGCALGFLVESFWDRGVEAYGKDISAYAISQVRSDMQPYCTQGSIADPINGKYDLITCIEVLEHIPEEEARQAIKSMAAVTDKIVFSSSPSDFSESTHINVRPPIYWLKQFAEVGFAPLSTYEPNFIAPHAFVVERSEQGRSEHDLLVFAKIIQLRVALSQSGLQIHEAQKQLANVSRDLKKLEQRESELAVVLEERAVAQRSLSVTQYKLAETQQEQAFFQIELSSTQRDLIDAQQSLALLQQSLNDERARNQVIVQELSNQLQATKRALQSNTARVGRMINFGRRIAKNIYWILTLKIFKVRRNRRMFQANLDTIRASIFFDGNWYLKTYTDVRDSNSDAAEHYLLYGGAEGRDPGPKFLTQAYLQVNPDINPKIINPLLHYLLYGIKENRSFAPNFRLQTGNEVDTLLEQSIAGQSPLRLYYLPHTRPVINLVLDSINTGSLFGGVGTSLIFAAKLSQKLDMPLRIITRTELPTAENFYKLLSFHDIPWKGNVEFVFSGHDKGVPDINVSDSDIFVTTSWWTTRSVKASAASKNIYYILQEDERMFYGAGDEQMRCAEILSDPDLVYIINSQLLYNHLVADGLDNIQKNGVWFEPSFPKRHYFYDTQNRGKKRNFFFYSRPNNLRNLYLRGLEAISAAIEQEIIRPDTWDIHFIGKDVGSVVLPQGVRPKVANNLAWDKYVALMRQMDVGLSLMYTPHVSYPPLDLAACGAVAVTNRYGIKTSLDRYSANILCVDPDVQSIANGIADAIVLAENLSQRRMNYDNSHISRDWESSFSATFDYIIPKIKERGKR